MKIKFYGATHEVTGSCTYLNLCGKHILVDCGMRQGSEVYEKEELQVPYEQVDYIFATHAHIDHTGNIPLAYKNGFRGKVICTYGTKSLCDIMLRDSAHIQMFEAEWKNRKAKRAGKDPIEPVYTMDDAENVIQLFEGFSYNKIYELFDGVKFRFVDAGHLLGSSSIEIWCTEDRQERKIVFSGDIGNFDQPLINNPSYIDEADYVIMESTYGNRLHGERINYIKDLADIIQETLDKGGNLVIPSFAVGRTQELLYFIRQIKEKDLIKNHSDFPVYVDSPLAIEATQIFSNARHEYLDKETLSLVKKGINPIFFSNLNLTITSEESKLINEGEEPKVIISASGMCDAGRIRHHLKHNLWRKDSTILFVGYQAVGTLGRILYDGISEVKLFGEKISVNANIKTLKGISGHADEAGLLKWVSSFRNKPKSVFIIHGEDTVCSLFADKVSKELNCHTVAPFSGAEYDLVHNVKIQDGICKKIKKKQSNTKESLAFSRLKAAGEKLMEVIFHNKGGSNKDLNKFARILEEIIEKWDR